MAVKRETDLSSTNLEIILSIIKNVYKKRRKIVLKIQDMSVTFF